jgi:hypothetical protein
MEKLIKTYLISLYKCLTTFYLCFFPKWVFMIKSQKIPKITLLWTCGWWTLILLSFLLPHFSFHLSFPTKFPQALFFPSIVGLFFWQQGVVTLKAQLLMLLWMTKHYYIKGKLLMLLWMIRLCYTKGTTIINVVNDKA